MESVGNYVANYLSSDQASFESFNKMRNTSGELFIKKYCMYTILKKFSGELSPTSNHKNNFPNKSALKAICKGKYLIFSPICRKASPGGERN